MKIAKFLEQSPVFACYQAHARIVDAFQHRLGPHGVHLLQGLVLTAMFFEDRPVRPGELRAVLQIEGSTLSHALTGLEKKSWIRRALHPEDARGYLLSLTPPGKRKALTLVKEFDRVQDGFEKNLGVRHTHQAVENLRALAQAYPELPSSGSPLP